MIVGADRAGRQSCAGERTEKREAKPYHAATGTALAVTQSLADAGTNGCTPLNGSDDGSDRDPIRLNRIVV